MARTSTAKRDIAGELEETRRHLQAVERRVAQLEAAREPSPPAAGDVTEPPLPPFAARDSLRAIRDDFARLPKSAWRGVPPDASKNLDKYMYGG